VSGYLSATEIRDLLIETCKIQLRNARDDLDRHPDDPGNPETRRLPAAESVRCSAALLRGMREIPADDPRLVRLAEMVPSVDMLAGLGSVTDRVVIGTPDGRIDAGMFLDSLVSAAARSMGNGRVT
jgi:hypothetical protein